MWPFTRRRTRGSQPAPPEPVFRARQPQPWEHVPAIQRSVTPLPLTLAPQRFADNLTSWQPPQPYLAPLVHAVSSQAPSGRIDNLLRPVQPNGADAGGPPLVLRRHAEQPAPASRTVQRLAWSTGEASVPSATAPADAAEPAVAVTAMRAPTVSGPPPSTTVSRVADSAAPELPLRRIPAAEPAAGGPVPGLASPRAQPEAATAAPPAQAPPAPDVSAEAPPAPELATEAAPTEPPPSDEPSPAADAEPPDVAPLLDPEPPTTLQRLVPPGETPQSPSAQPLPPLAHGHHEHTQPRTTPFAPQPGTDPTAPTVSSQTRRLGLGEPLQRSTPPSPTPAAPAPAPPASVPVQRSTPSTRAPRSQRVGLGAPLRRTPQPGEAPQPSQPSQTSEAATADHPTSQQPPEGPAQGPIEQSTPVQPGQAPVADTASVDSPPTEEGTAPLLGEIVQRATDLRGDSPASAGDAPAGHADAPLPLPVQRSADETSSASLPLGRPGRLSAEPNAAAPHAGDQPGRTAPVAATALPQVPLTHVQAPTFGRVDSVLPLVGFTAQRKALLDAAPAPGTRAATPTGTGAEGRAAGGSRATVPAPPVPGLASSRSPGLASSALGPSPSTPAATTQPSPRSRVQAVWRTPEATTPHLGAPTSVPPASGFGDPAAPLTVARTVAHTAGEATVRAGGALASPVAAPARSGGVSLGPVPAPGTPAPWQPAASPSAGGLGSVGRSGTGALQALHAEGPAPAPVNGVHRVAGPLAVQRVERPAPAAAPVAVEAPVQRLDPGQPQQAAPALQLPQSAEPAETENAEQTGGGEALGHPRTWDAETLEVLARRLYDGISRRIKHELRSDRERAGRLIDLRR